MLHEDLHVLVSCPFELTCVSTDVSLEQPRAWESLAAQLADARKGVCPYVHFECAEAYVLLLAVLAAEGLARVRVAMQLLVLEQARVRRVRLVTQSAAELLRHIRAAGTGGGGDCDGGRLLLLVFVAPRDLVAVFGRWVSRHRREVSGKRWRRRVARRPHRDRTVHHRAQHLGLRDHRHHQAFEELLRHERCKPQNMFGSTINKWGLFFFFPGKSNTFHLAFHHRTAPAWSWFFLLSNTLAVWSSCIVSGHLWRGARSVPFKLYSKKEVHLQSSRCTCTTHSSTWKMHTSSKTAGSVSSAHPSECSHSSERFFYSSSKFSGMFWTS